MEIWMTPYEIKAVGSITSPNELFGFLTFERCKPDHNGESDLVIQAPVSLLSQIAAAALRAIPAASAKHEIPMVTPDRAEVRTGKDGECVLVFGFGSGSIAFDLDPDSAAVLALGIQASTGRPVPSRDDESNVH